MLSQWNTRMNWRVFRTSMSHVRGPLAPDVSVLWAVSVFESRRCQHSCEENGEKSKPYARNYSGFCNSIANFPNFWVRHTGMDHIWDDDRYQPGRSALPRLETAPRTQGEPQIHHHLWSLERQACVMSKCTDLSYSQTAGIIFYDKGKTANMNW